MSITRVQALQLLGLKVGASGQQITESYHKQHPAAERAATEGKPERLRRLDEAYRLLMMENDTELKRGGEEGEQNAAPGAKPGGKVDAAQFRRDQERINANRGGGGMLWLAILLVAGVFLAGWYLNLIPGLPRMFGK